MVSGFIKGASIFTNVAVVDVATSGNPPTTAGLVKVTVPTVSDMIFTVTWPLAFVVVVVLFAGVIVGVKAGLVVTP